MLNEFQVSNAPHIPVHLGAMGETVKYQIEHNQLKNGDVTLSNHPLAGGSHLPDFTVITPVFHKNQEKPIFYVASRGHHADIGGLTPGNFNKINIFIGIQINLINNLKVQCHHIQLDWIKKEQHSCHSN